MATYEGTRWARAMRAKEPDLPVIGRACAGGCAVSGAGRQGAPRSMTTLLMRCACGPGHRGP